MNGLFLPKTRVLKEPRYFRPPMRTAMRYWPPCVSTAITSAETAFIGASYSLTSPEMDPFSKLRARRSTRGGESGRDSHRSLMKSTFSRGSLVITSNPSPGRREEIRVWMIAAAIQHAALVDSNLLRTSRPESLPYSNAAQNAKTGMEGNRKVCEELSASKRTTSAHARVRIVLLRYRGIETWLPNPWSTEGILRRSHGLAAPSYQGAPTGSLQRQHRLEGRALSLRRDTWPRGGRLDGIGPAHEASHRTRGSIECRLGDFSLGLLQLLDVLGRQLRTVHLDRQLVEQVVRVVHAGQRVGADIEASASGPSHLTRSMSIMFQRKTGLPFNR